jgi:hypothetical protein
MNVVRLVAVLFFVSAFALILSSRICADIVVLNDGRELEGEVEEDGDVIIIKSKGIKTKIDKAEVKEIKKSGGARQALEEKCTALAKSDKAKDADAWFTLANFAKDRGLQKEANDLYKRTIELNADHEGARTALGQVRYLGQWVDKDKGEGGGGGAANAQRGTNGPVAVNAPAPAQGEQVAAPQPAMKVELVNCPKCDGNKVVKAIPGKFAGMACLYCNGTGKINPAQVRDAYGRLIPKGFKPCGTCGATGVANFGDCDKCAKSEFPGLTKSVAFGWRPCDRCGGSTKIPGMRCKDCSGSGFVKE